MSLRKKFRIQLEGYQRDIDTCRKMFNTAKYLEACDLYEQLLYSYPEKSTEILAELYDIYQRFPHKDRYNLYQARLFDFNIKSTDKVLDIGSGHIPFPLATHLADIAIEDNNYGRGGTAFKHIEGKPVFVCELENTYFEDNEFDFVYCSHVLEHSHDPEKACKELMRIGKRGYIETPSKGKDLLLNSARISNHKYWVEVINNKLTFSEYTPEEINGIQSSILMEMHVSPRSIREKAFSALIYLKANFFNTMFEWNEKFNYEICFTSQAKRMSIHPKEKMFSNNDQENSKVDDVYSQKEKKLKFLQIHTFYTYYLNQFYQNNPQLKQASFNTQIDALIADGFSGIHIFPPYMKKLNYDTQLIVANNIYSQMQWLAENNCPSIDPKEQHFIFKTVKDQIEKFQPDILYLGDPILFDSKFIRILTWKPSLIIGWRAANIPETTDWSEFDIIFSCLSRLRDVALKLGAKHTEHFFPGFPDHIYDIIKNISPKFDVGFTGTWSLNQHPHRNYLLDHIAKNASTGTHPYSCGFFLSGQLDKLTPEVNRYSLGSKFGLSMYRSLRSARIIFDARGILEIKNVFGQSKIDLAANETANMRIFEATGCGAFLLTEHFNNLKQLFEIGKEIETFHDETELIDKIRYYLAHPEQREMIARKGHERCLKDYSIDNRAKEFDRIIRKYLAEKNNKPFSITIELRDKVIAHINQKDYQKAFDLIIQAKSQRNPAYNLDYLKAICFLNMNRPYDAKESLKEELRFFPKNEDAQKLLDQLEAHYSQPVPKIYNYSEFNDLYKQIQPYTMVSEKRIFSLFVLTRHICMNDFPGNFVECGVAAGGTSALIASIIKKYSKQKRFLYAFDSFEGMLEPTNEDVMNNGATAQSVGWGTGTCAASKQNVVDMCKQMDLADIIIPVKGYFKDTLPQKRNEIGSIAFLHLDGDWYESTKSILTNLYDNIITGGVLQVDDYGHWAGCKKAIHEFESQNNLKFVINNIDGSGVWFIKK
jgi:ubiquinone/menaquinone biosynthesis C-methylase UbiE